MPPLSPTAYPPSSGVPAPSPLVEIVADGGPRFGYGHLGRCLAVWEALDGAAAFALSDPDAAGFVAERGARATPAPEAPVVLLDRVAPCPAADVSGLQGHGRRVALLDDLGEGRAIADLVIDPPTAAAWPPAGARRLAGFEHVLLRKEVTEAVRAPAPAGVLLALGGSDPAGLTPELARALSGAGHELVVNLGPGYRGDRDVPGRVVASSTDFVAELAQAQLLVAAYGHSLLEAAYLGVPALIVVAQPEHLEHATAFAENGTAALVDMTAGPRPDELVRVVGELVADPAAATALGRRGSELVDGRGAARVARALRELAA